MSSPDQATPEATSPPAPSQTAPESPQPSAQGAPASTSESIRVYHPPSNGSSSLPPDLPDSFFEPTAAELQSAYATQAKKVENLSNAPLKTQAIREKEQKARLDRWPNTTIRIKFANQMMIERTFPSTERIKSVYAFVRGLLVEEALGDKFVLYQPPRRELKVSDPETKRLTLGQLELSPTSQLLVRFQTAAYNDPSLQPPLLPQIIQQSVPLPTASSPEAPSGTSSATTKPKTSSSMGEKKVPKWFKMGKK